MSRRKRVLPSQNHSNLNRIQPVSQRLGEVDREFQNLHQHLDLIRQERSEITSSPQDNYDPYFEDTINAFHNQLQAIDFRNNQALTAQSDYFRTQVENLQAEIWDQTTTQLEEQDGWLEDTFAPEHALQLSRINQLQETLAAIQQDASHRRAVAWQTIEAAKELYEFLHIQYNSEPGWQAETQGLLYQLQQSQVNLENGFEETALAGAQQTYHRLEEIRNYLQQFIHLRQNAISAVQDSANEIVVIIQQNQRVRAVDLQGMVLPTELEVDFWSDGQLRPLFRQVKTILHHLQSPPYTFEMEEIHNLGERLVFIKEQIPKVVLNARIQALSSQLRFSIAECVLAALRTQGYELSFAGFVESDMRNPYHLNMENLAGSQVYVTISQLPQQPLSQILELETNDQEALSEYEMRQRASELDAALSLFGLSVGLIPGPDSIFSPVAKTSRPTNAPNLMQMPSLKAAKIDFRSH